MGRSGLLRDCDVGGASPKGSVSVGPTERSGLPRTVHILRPNESAAGNVITTYKYTPLTFIPLVL